MIKRLANLALLCIGFTFFAKAQNTLTVCPAGSPSSPCAYTTLQAAIDAAASGDIILLNVNGEFTEKGMMLPEKNLTIRGLGKTTTILQSATTRASASGGRLFRYPTPTGAGGTRITFEDMTMRYALAPVGDIPNGTGQSQGGVFHATGNVKGLTVTVNRVKFYANETTGGSVQGYGPCFYISSTGGGANAANAASLTLNNCDFDDNKAAPVASGYFADGACLWLAGSPNQVVVNGCTFTNNSAYTRGGAAYIAANWTTTIQNCLFENNTVQSGDGGALHVRAVAALKMENSLFRNNTVCPSGIAPPTGITLYGAGGAVICYAGLIRNCTFVGNSAIKGGALCRGMNGSAGVELLLLNSTFSANTASGTGRTIQYGVLSSTSIVPLSLVNTIITNGGGAAAAEIHFLPPYSSLVTNTKNYCNSVSTENGSAGSVPTFEFNSTTHPNLGLSTVLASNGGPLPTLALQVGSPMINAGSTAMRTTGTVYDISAKDGRSYSRTDGGIDVGAFEYGGVADNPASPEITNVTLGTAQPNGDRAITANIADVNGVYWFPQLTDLRPRLYFRKNNGTWFSIAGNLTGGNGRSGTWSFDLSAATLGGLAAGDRLEYYVITQDVSGTPAIASAPAGAVATDVLSIIVPPPTTVKVLPVKLEAFAVRKAGKDAVISWTVGDEQALSHYEVERSTDASQWTVIGRRVATGARTYEWKDGGLTAALYFYRLRSVDKNGDYSLSAIRKLEIEGTNALLVYPNPVTGTTATVVLEKGSTVSLYNSAGILLWTKAFTAGAHTISVQELPAGTYRLVSGSTSASLLVP